MGCLCVCGVSSVCVALRKKASPALHKGLKTVLVFFAGHLQRTLKTARRSRSLGGGGVEEEEEGERVKGLLAMGVVVLMKGERKRSSKFCSPPSRERSRVNITWHVG